MKINNVTVEKEDMLTESKDPKSLIHKYIKLAESIGLDLIPFIPSKIKHTVKFELVDAPSAVSNAIRRGLYSEYMCWSMLCKFPHIKTNDEHMLADQVSTFIEGIPILQDGPIDETWTASLDFTNTTDRPCMVLSSNIKIKDGAGKSIPYSDVFSGLEPIAINLKPGGHIKAPITFGIGNGETNGNSFKPCGIVYYKELENLDKNIFTYEPNRHLIGYQTYGNFNNPFTLLVRICDNIIERINTIHSIVSEFKDNEPKLDKKVLFNNDGELFKYIFKTETVTIANLYATYVRYEIPGKFAAGDKEHASLKEVFVRLDSPVPHQVMLEAGKKIIEVFTQIKSFFLNVKV